MCTGILDNSKTVTLILHNQSETANNITLEVAIQSLSIKFHQSPVTG